MEPNLCLHLLSQILGSDNNARSNAETTFTEANEKQPNEYVLSLATILANPAVDESLRNLAVVMLRRAVMRNPNFSIWEKLTPETRQSLQNQTLEILTLTQSRKMLLQVSDMAASLASSVLSAKDTKWEGLLQLLLNWTRSNSELQREAALQIFFDLLRLTDLKQYFEQLSNIFIQAVSDSSIQVRIVALQAISQLVHITLNTSKYRNQFKPCVPKAFEIITSYNDDNEELVVKTLEILIEMAELFPDFIENYIDQTFETLLTVASNENISSSVSNLSLELLVTLAENKPSYLRKRVAFLTRVIHFILSLITKVEDNDQWNLGEEYDEEDEESAIGGAAIDRLALSVGETIVPIIFNSIPGMLQSPNWTYRHAALTVISYVGEGCAELLHQNLEQIVQLILPSFKDPHPRVRWAACNTIGQMSTDFAPQLQETFHAEILHYLIAVMDDVENPRVQSYAAAAIINFCECDKEIILPYLNPLLAKLFQLLEQQKVIVVIQAITAIAAVADCVGDDFIPFYNNFMPILKTILFEATGKDQLKLRGKAIEGISIIAAVVGRDTFLPDSEQVLGVFFELYNSNLPADDPRLGFLQSAWGRICKALGKDFAKYLPLLLPSVLKSAGVDADVKLVTDTQDGADDDQWYLLEIDKDHTLAINTIVLQEKSSALSLLYWMACELKEAFFPFVSEVAPICAKSLLFFYHEEVRTTAAQIIPHLIRCTKYAVAAGQQPQQAVNELFTYFVPHFVKAIKNEIDRDVVIAYCECFTEAIDVAGSNSLTPALMERVLKVSFKTLEDFTNNRKLILHQMKTLEATGDDTDDFKKKLKEQQIVLVRIGELVGKIIETHGEVVLPYLGPINAVFEFFVKDESTLHVELQSALCYFDDLVEFAGPAALSVYESWIPYAIKFVNHPDADVRQSAAFGMGLLAEHQQQNFPHILAPVLTELNQMILAEKSRSKKNIHATENAISAMGKIISFHANQINIAQILPTWLSYLPIYEDDESATIYGMLCRFFMAYEQVLVGDNFVNLPHLVAILTFVLENPHLVADDTGNLIVTILKKILHEYPQEVVKQLWGTLPANQQSILQSLV